MNCCRLPTVPPNMAPLTAKSLFQFHHILGDPHANSSNCDLLYRPSLQRPTKQLCYNWFGVICNRPLVNALRRIMDKSNPSQAPTKPILTSITVAHYHRTVWFSLHLISYLYRTSLSISFPPLRLPSYFILVALLTSLSLLFGFLLHSSSSSPLLVSSAYLSLAFLYQSSSTLFLRPRRLHRPNSHGDRPFISLKVR